MPTAESEQESPRRKPARSFDSLAFAKRLQAGGAFTREQAEGLTEQIYAALFNPSPAPSCLKAFLAVGFSQKQADALIKYTKDYVTFFRGAQNV